MQEFKQWGKKPAQRSYGHRVAGDVAELSTHSIGGYVVDDQELEQEMLWIMFRLRRLPEREIEVMKKGYAEIKERFHAKNPGEANRANRELYDAIVDKRQAEMILEVRMRYR